MTFRTIDDRPSADQPGGIRLAHHRVRRFLPHLYEPDSLGKMIGWMAGDRGFWREHLEQQMTRGRRRPAIVVSTVPLLVAAYSGQFDWIALLQFPPILREELQLESDDKLLSINSHLTGKGRAKDLREGPAATGRYANFSPIIAEFFSDDFEAIEKAKNDIKEGLWERTAVCAEAYLREHGPVARDGLPTRNEAPADV